MTDQHDKLRRLPIVQIFTVALTLPVRYFRVLLRFGWPIITLLIAIPLYDLYGGPAIESVQIWVQVIFIFLLINVVVACHRTFLLESEEVQATPVVRVTLREIVYTGWWVGIAIITSVVIIPLGLTFIILYQGSLIGFYSNSFLIESIVNIPVYYVFGRLSLVLPATAVDVESSSLSWSWNLTRGNGWRLTLLLGIIPLVTGLLSKNILSYESGYYLLLTSVIWLVAGVVEIGLLSLSYDYLSKVESTSE